jgi:hypothetical protein
MQKQRGKDRSARHNYQPHRQLSQRTEKYEREKALDVDVKPHALPSRF